MVKITLIIGGMNHEMDVLPGQSIAGAASTLGISLYGECEGEGRCLGCCRRVISGAEKLFNKKLQTRYAESDGPVMAQTCKTTPLEDGAVIDGNL